MRAPKPSNWFGGYSWLGFINRFVLRWLWLRLFVTIKTDYTQREMSEIIKIATIGLYVAHPGAMYKDDVNVKAFRKILFEVTL